MARAQQRALASEFPSTEHLRFTAAQKRSSGIALCTAKWQQWYHHYNTEIVNDKITDLEQYMSHIYMSLLGSF